MSKKVSSKQYKRDVVLNRSDADAIRSDWQAVNNDLWYVLGKYDPPTLLDQQERPMNDLKPLARYLSPILIAVSILIVIFIFVHVPDAADYPFIAIMLALVAIWLQGVTKT